MDAVTLVGGALVGLLILAELFFHPIRASTRREKLLALVGKTLFLSVLIGWLAMWLTEEEIFSTTPHSCQSLASIELKGQVFRHCSYLVHLYQAGEWLFGGALAAIAALVILGRIAEKRR